MYDFECLSDSSASSRTIKESNILCNNITPQQDSDLDSDSTIIIEDDMNNMDECTSPRTMPNKSNGITNYLSTNTATCVHNEYMDLDKPIISNYSKDKGTFFPKDKIDPELESILLKYASPPLVATSTNRNCMPTSIAKSTIANEKHELIELSSDEDEDFPRIQKMVTKPSSTTLKNQVEKDEIDGELSEKYKVTASKDHPQIQTENRIEALPFSGGTVDVDFENQLSNEFIQMLDEDVDLPRINIKKCKQITSSAKTVENDHEYDNGYINGVANSVNNYQKEVNVDLYRSPRKKRKLSPEENNKKIDKAAVQAKKREEAERAKKLKQAILAANKNMKPEECMKFITVVLDSEIAHEKYGGDILNALQTADIAYRVQPQIIPHTVTWNRKVESHLMDAEEQLMATADVVETNEILLILEWKQVTELVHNRSLVTHVKSLQSILANKTFSLAIYGIENYFKYQKSQKQREMRSEISQTSQKTNTKHDKIYKDTVRISRKQLEFALTELQLLCCCCHRMVDSADDLGAMIIQFTKSIAQAPYKLEKQRKQQEEEWYMSGDNKDCVQVDKNGNGLQRLWQQQLTTFPLARLEHAEAIVSKYSTPTSLMEGYSLCTQTEGEKLLQDIPIRRAAGPLTTVRKIGPELSKKVYKFFNSTDGNCVL